MASSAPTGPDSIIGSLNALLRRASIMIGMKAERLTPGRNQLNGRLGELKGSKGGVYRGSEKRRSEKERKWMRSSRE